MCEETGQRVPEMHQRDSGVGGGSGNGRGGGSVWRAGGPAIDLVNE